MNLWIESILDPSILVLFLLVLLVGWAFKIEVVQHKMHTRTEKRIIVRRLDREEHGGDWYD